MGDVVTLYDVTPQEEIFIQYYLITGNRQISAYNAHFAQLKEEKPFEELTAKEKNTLSTAATRCLNRDKVKERISQLAREEAEKNSCATLEEILAYLTTVVRKSKENEFRNIGLVNMAITAINTLIKRYPNFEGSAGADEKIVFKRGTSGS